MKIKTFKELANGETRNEYDLSGFTTIIRKNESIHIKPEKPTLRVLKTINENNLFKEDLSSFSTIIREEKELSFEPSIILREGKQGKDGLNGINGKDGKNGKDGLTPIKNLDYFDGVNGKDGKDGRNGKDGVDGKDGLNGINGKDGKQGIQGLNGNIGVPGVNGKNGKNGKDGYTPVKDIDYFDGKDGNQGIAGKDGLNGTNGKDGKDGKDGLNGSNGKDGVDGKQGISGKDGRSIVGPKGDSGKNGERGERGLSGIQGKQGIQGLIGLQGIPGLNGINGKDGVDGKDGKIPHHEYQKGNLRFESSPGVWGSWIDLNSLVKKATKATTVEMGGSGAKAIQFKFKDLLVQDISRVTFDPDTFNVEYDDYNGLIVKSFGASGNISTPSVSSAYKPYIDVYTSVTNQLIYNTTYIPIPDTELVTLNGLILSPIIDYTINNGTIELISRHKIRKQQIISVRYQYV